MVTESNRRGLDPNQVLTMSYEFAMEHGTAEPTAPAGFRKPGRNGETAGGPLAALPGRV